MTASAPTVLVVDDSPEIRAIVGRLLRREGWPVETAVDASEALESARRVAPDVIVLDLGLPGTDGLELCGALRTFTDAYIIMLTGRESDTDKVVGLTMGADDYVTKPFSGVELVARVRAMLRRPRAASTVRDAAPPLRRLGDLEIDLGAREVLCGETAVALTRKEFDLLAVLSEAPNIVFTRQQLLDAAWGPDWFGDDHVVDVHMSNLRRKLRQALGGADAVCTVRGVGYRLGRPRAADAVGAPMPSG